MVPALLYLLFKKLRAQDWTRIRKNLMAHVFMRSNQVIIALIILLLLTSFILSAQKQTRNYKVVRNGSEIGWVNVDKSIDSNVTTIMLSSEIKTRFLFTFSNSARELSEFKDGKLCHSYFYRKTNGSVKADRHTQLTGDNYEVSDESEKAKLNIPVVNYSTLCMYFEEPLERKLVYSDNYQRFLEIKKEKDGGYTITAPDGNINSFYYSSGICFKVKINSTFYSATLLLK